MIMRMTVAILATIGLTAASLPVAGPLPAEKPGEKQQQSAPEAAPKRDIQAATPDAADVPTPLEKPEAPKAADAPSEVPAPKSAEPETQKEPEPPPQNIVKEDPQAYAACVAELKTAGAEFTEAEPISEEEGSCGIEKPITLSKPLPGIALSDKSPMRCEAALALSHWLKDTVEPALKVAFPDRKITGVRNAPSYACRKRNHAETGKISEHAKGSAIDIIALEFDKGELIEMKPKAEDPTMEGAFQRTATAGACLHFRTVLSPGSDATHEDHLHLDVLERKGEYRYCR